MNVLVTGGCGYIGSHAALRLLALGHAVTVVDDLSRGHRAVIDRLQPLGDLAFTQSERRAAAEQAIALAQNVMGEHALDEDFQATVQSFKQRADTRQPRTFGMRHRP